MAKKKRHESTGCKSPTQYPNTYYTKFKKVHLAASGSIVLCKATTVDGVTEHFCWNTRSNRELIKKNSLPDVEVVIEKNVPVDKGWDYVG